MTNAIDYSRHVDYIHWNSVKHSWVQRKDWPFSSFHAYVRRGILPLDWPDEPENVDAGESLSCHL